MSVFRSTRNSGSGAKCEPGHIFVALPVLEPLQGKSACSIQPMAVLPPNRVCIKSPTPRYIWSKFRRWRVGRGRAGLQNNSDIIVEESIHSALNKKNVSIHGYCHE
jgi:hypothetical protein